MRRPQGARKVAPGGEEPPVMAASARLLEAAQDWHDIDLTDGLDGARRSWW
jgi:hypothetical protein